jgi:hypothetical protein
MRKIALVGELNLYCKRATSYIILNSAIVSYLLAPVKSTNKSYDDLLTSEHSQSGLHLAL